MADKLMDRIAKVLHQAENASTPEEAEAYMRKAQELATANAIDLAMARAHQHDQTKRQQPEERTVRILGESDRHRWKRSTSVKWKAELYLAIARVNDLQCLIGGDGAYIYPYGFPGDLDVAEALYNSLVVQMVASADEALKRGANKGMKRVYKTELVRLPENEWYWDYDPKRGGDYQVKSERRQVRDPETGEKIIEEKLVSLVDGRIFRQNFYEGFIARVTGRLWEAKREAEKQYNVGKTEEQTSETGLVLRSKALEVREYLEQKNPNLALRGTYKGASTGESYNPLGQEHGRQAGSAAQLGSEVAVGGSRVKGEIG